MVGMCHDEFVNIDKQPINWNGLLSFFALHFISCRVVFQYCFPMYHIEKLMKIGHTCLILPPPGNQRAQARRCCGVSPPTAPVDLI